MLELKDYDFQRFVTFIQSNYGIDLSKKKHLVVGRLSNSIPTMGFDSFREYIDYILATPNPSDITLMLNKLTTNYTYFMRETAQFEYFKQVILPQLEARKKTRSINIWCAGCSSGEEAYTLSMIMKDYFGSHNTNWDTRLLATDLSQHALDLALKGCYTPTDVLCLPDTWKSKYLKQAPGDPNYYITPLIKENVIFRSFNLMDPFTFKVKFDVIFCRNVMIYFDNTTKTSLVNRFYQATAPGGYLFIGQSEALQRDTHPYHYLMPSTFQKL